MNDLPQQMTWEDLVQQRPAFGDWPVPGEPVLTETVAHARRTDPETSHAAAASVEDLRPRQRAVLTLLAAQPSHHDALIERYRAWHTTNPEEFPRQAPSGIRTRVAELRDVGYVRDSGGRVTLPSGRHAIVWEATP